MREKDRDRDKERERERRKKKGYMKQRGKIFMEKKKRKKNYDGN